MDGRSMLHPGHLFKRKTPMKAITRLLLMILLSVSAAVATRAQSDPPPAPQETVQELKDRVSSAAVAIYHGQQICKWVTNENFFFGPSQNWECKFQTNFTCTGTVYFRNPNTGANAGLTAGHCFDRSEVEKGNYYVALEIDKNPVLHKMYIQKFENDERYDFATFMFESRNPGIGSVSLGTYKDGSPA